MAEAPLIFDVHRASTHDGPGLRTVFFVKGCSLRCAWCHNPESIAPGADLWWRAERCIACRACVAADDTGVLSAVGDPQAGTFSIQLARPLSRYPEAAVAACPTGALEPIGRSMTPEQAVETALRDEIFVAKSGGGITVSGGEPLLYPDYLAGLFGRYHEASASGTTAVDTAGHVPWRALEAVLPHSDFVFLDLKAADDDLHRGLVGAGVERIHENARRLAAWIRVRGESAPKLIIRTPLVPSAGSGGDQGSGSDPGGTAGIENLAALGAFIRDQLADVVDRWELCAFHNLAADKYRRLGIDWAYARTDLLTADEAEGLRAAAAAAVGPSVSVISTGLTARMRPAGS